MAKSKTQLHSKARRSRSQDYITIRSKKGTATRIKVPIDDVALQLGLELVGLPAAPVPEITTRTKSSAGQILTAKSHC